MSRFFVVVLALAVPAIAQRGNAKIQWQKLESLIDYGEARIGAYTLENLPPGRTWRLGNGPPTTLVTAMPVMAGDTVIAPGHYQLQLRRAGEETFNLVVEGAAQGLGGGGQPVSFEGDFRAEKKPSKKLELLWTGSGKKQGKNQDTALTIRFGPYGLEVPLTVLGNESSTKLPGYKVHAFTYTAAVMAARLRADKPTPVASLIPKKTPKKGEPEFFNLILEEKEARLVAAVQLPSQGGGEGGRGGQPQLAEPVVRRGTVQWGEDEKEHEHLIVRNLTAKKDGSIELEVCYAKRVGHVVIEGKK